MTLALSLRHLPQVSDSRRFLVTTPSPRCSRIWGCVGGDPCVYVYVRLKPSHQPLGDDVAQAGHPFNPPAASAVVPVLHAQNYEAGDNARVRHHAPSQRNLV